MDLSDYLALQRELRCHNDYEESMIGVNEDVPDDELSPIQERRVDQAL